MAASTPKIKDFENGKLACPSCSTELGLDSGEPLEIKKCPECGVPVFYPYKIKDYWLYQPLGGGGMGSVYKAIDITDNEDYAVKVLPRAIKNDEQFIDILLREGEAGYNIGEHPHVIAIVEYGHDEETDEAYMASQFIPGDRLDMLIKTEQRLTEKRALEIIIELIEAEAHIFESGYLFRDMKPENVMIEENGNVRLFDYGLCLSVEDAASSHQSSDLEGSPFYLPPERIVGAAEGAYSEIYSLGMILFFMLAGRTYYSEADIKDLIKKHVTSLRVASVANHLKHCNPKTISTLDKMISRNPNSRYHDFQELKEKLEEILEEVKKVPEPMMSIDSPMQGTGLGMQGTGIGMQRVAHTQKSGTPKSKMPLLLTVLAISVLITISFFSYLFYKDYSLQKRSEAIVLKELKRKGINISMDVQEPPLNHTEINKQIAEKTESIFSSKKSSLKDFDPEKEKDKIFRELKITKVPNKSLSELSKLYSQEYNQRVNAALEEKMGPFSENKIKEALAKQNGLEFPLKAPSEGFDKVERLYKSRIWKEVKEKYPKKLLGAEKMKIIRKYQAYRVGQDVTIIDKHGNKFEGKFKGCEGNKILIGDSQAFITDLSKNEADKFNEAICQRKIARIIKLTEAAFAKTRQDYKDKLDTEKARTEFFSKYGYYYSNKKWLSAEGTLKSGVDLARRKYNDKKKSLKKKVQKEVAAKFRKDKFLTDKGYRKMNGKWQSAASVVDKILKQRKNKFQAKRKRELNQIRADAKKQAEKQIYSANRYVCYENNWIPAKLLLQQRIMMKKAELEDKEKEPEEAKEAKEAKKSK